jgi:hypothetical protein
MERRKFIRVLAFSSIRLFTAGREILFDGDLLDISKGGVCVANIDRQKFEFELVIGEDQVKGTAIIAWLDSERMSMGLEFVKIVNDEDRTNLEALLNSFF